MSLPFAAEPARWCAPPSDIKRFDVNVERALLAASSSVPGLSDHPLLEWGELDWARLFQEPEGPTMRPVPLWRAAIRVLLADAGPAACVEVLLTHVHRYGQRVLSARQEAPGARDVRWALSRCSQEAYESARSVAEAHQEGPKRARLAAYLFPDQDWWQAFTKASDWLDIAPCPRDVGVLPTAAPEGVDVDYLSTLAAAYGSGAIQRICDWSEHSSRLAEVLVQMDSDDALLGWMRLWDARAAFDIGFREGITAVERRDPERWLLAALRLLHEVPERRDWVARWVARLPDVAEALRPSLTAVDAALFDSLTPEPEELPDGWSQRVAGSRQFPPPINSRLVSATEESVRNAPLHLAGVGVHVESPREWSGALAQEYLSAVDNRYALDIIRWVLVDAGEAAAVRLLLACIGKHGHRWRVPGAQEVRNALAVSDDVTYAESLSVATTARQTPSPDVLTLTAFLFPDQPWWRELVEEAASKPRVTRETLIVWLAPLPTDPVDLPQGMSWNPFPGPVLPSWLWAYGQSIVPLLIDWLQAADGVCLAVAEALCWIASADAIRAVALCAFDPSRGTNESVLELLDVAPTALVVSALVDVDGAAAKRAWKRRVFLDPQGAHSVEHPAVQDVLAQVSPPTEPVTVAELAPLFQAPMGVPSLTHAVPKPTVDPRVVLSPVERGRVEAMLARAERPSTGVDRVVGLIVAGEWEAFERAIRSITPRNPENAALLDDLALVALHLHGASAEWHVACTRNHYDAPPAALCTERVVAWMLDHACRGRFDVERHAMVEGMSEYHFSEWWQDRMTAEQWMRRHPDVAAEVFLWAALSPDPVAADPVTVQVTSGSIEDLMAALNAVSGSSGAASKSARKGAQAVLPWLLNNLGEPMRSAAERLGVTAALGAWRETRGLAEPIGADLEWLETWRLPWLTLSDGRVLPREAVTNLLEYCVRSRVDVPSRARDAALDALSHDSKVALSRAIREQVEHCRDAFGLWALQWPVYLGDPDARAWLVSLATSSESFAREAAVDELWRLGDVSALQSVQRAMACEPSQLPGYPYPSDKCSVAAQIQWRLHCLSMRNEAPHPVQEQDVAPVSPPPTDHRFNHYAGLQVPFERFTALVSHRWALGPQLGGKVEGDRLGMRAGTGRYVVLQVPSSNRKTATLGPVQVLDVFKPDMHVTLSDIPHAVWGQVVADLDGLVAGLSLPGREAIADQVERVVRSIATSGRWACMWLARPDSPGILVAKTKRELDEGLTDLRDLSEPYGGFTSVMPHASGLFALTWSDGEVLVVGAPPEDTTGLAFVITRARAVLIP